MKRMLLTLFLFCAVMIPARSLDLGDPAPAISAEQWVSGEAADPTKVDDNTVYLVEVWSVTCPPCVQTIPLLNGLQAKYADKGFKIVSFTSDAVADVLPFLEEHPMEYSSFIDKEGATTVNYMAADNRNTIPHAFLFDRSGALVWIGNPLDNLERRLNQVFDGTLTREKALAIRDSREKLQTAFSSQDISGMLSSLVELESIEPDNAQYYQIHYRILTEMGMGEDGEIQDLLNAWYKGCSEQMDALAILSVVAMDQGPPNHRNPELALAAAKRAYSLEGPGKMQAGLNLAETYKSIGRMDLAMETIGELSAGADTDGIEILAAVEGFYRRLETLGKDPDAEYKP